MLQVRTVVDRNKTLVRELYHAFNDGNLGALPDFFDPTFLHHSPAPGQPRGVTGIRQTWSQLRGQFPDLSVELNDLLAEGTRVVARGTFYSGGVPLGRFLEVFLSITAR